MCSLVTSWFLQFALKIVTPLLTEMSSPPPLRDSCAHFKRCSFSFVLVSHPRELCVCRRVSIFHPNRSQSSRHKVLGATQFTFYHPFHHVSDPGYGVTSVWACVTGASGIRNFQQTHHPVRNTQFSLLFMRCVLTGLQALNIHEV